MPKDTYFNLNPEKREIIFRAAIAEFKRVPFEKVSIKNIVEAAGIPRGSFYQYFEDKEDLMVHVILEIKKAGNAEAEDPADISDWKGFSVVLEKLIDKELSRIALDGAPSDRAEILKNIAASPQGLVIFDRTIQRQFLQRSRAWDGSFLKGDLDDWQAEALADLLVHSFRKAFLDVLSGRRQKEDAIRDFRFKLERIIG